MLEINVHLLSSSLSEGTHSSKSDVIDNRMKSSFLVEPVSILEYKVKQNEDDAGSIKEEGDLGIKLSVINKKTEDGETNEESHDAMAALEENAATAGELEEKEEIDQGGSADSQVEQKYMGSNGSELICAVTTSGEQSGTDAGGEADTAI